MVSECVKTMRAASDADAARVCRSVGAFARNAYRGGSAVFTEVRVVHLSRLVRECFREAFQEPLLGYKELRSRFGFSAPTLEGVEAIIDEKVPLPSVSSWDPTLVGWAFQAWGEPLRDQSSWGVSYAAADNAEEADVSALTQIFTDQYIADFLAASSLHLSAAPEGAPRKICDPGCGTGHLLIAALRASARDGRRGQCELYGFDIDPFAVELCRALLFAEHIRLGAVTDLGSVWRKLESRIITVPSPLGILDRTIELPGNNFDVVIANPPYLGRRKMPAAMREYLDAHYPETKIDLCAAFLRRVIEILVEGGSVGFVASDKWLRLGSYRSFRAGQGSYRGFLREVAVSEIIELGPKAFTARSKMHDGVRVAVLIGQKILPTASHVIRYSSLSEVTTYEDKVAVLSERYAQGISGTRLLQDRLISSEDSSPFLETSDLPEAVRNIRGTVADVAQVVVGQQTNDDARFVRYVWEVPPVRSRWRVHSKGAGYCRWFGHNHWIIDWEGGKQFFFKSRESLERAESWVDRAGWCYGWFANGCLGLRVKEAGWTFGRAATSAVFCDDSAIVSFLNSRWASLCVRYIGGKMQIPEGVVRRVPMPSLTATISSRLVEAAVHLKRRLVSMDPADAIFEPQVSSAWNEEYLLQALLLLVEGVLESQIERELQFAQGESDRLAKRYGVPAAWIAPVTSDIEAEFWEKVPIEYQWLREIVSDDCRRVRTHERRHPDYSPAEVITAFQKRGGVDGDTWALPITSPIERMSRLWKVHPMQSVTTLLRSAARNPSVYAVVVEPTLSRGALSSLLERLGHRWWSQSGEVEREGGTTFSLMEAARIVLRHPQFETCWVGEEREVSEWLRGRFSDWHNKIFHKRSPLREHSAKSGEIVYAHLWDETSVDELTSQ